MRGITAGYGYRPIPSCSLSFLIGEQNKKKKNYFVSGSLIMVKPCWTNLIPTMNRKQTALGESRNAGVAAKYSGLDGSRCNPRTWVSPEANCGPRQSTVTVDSQVSTGIIQKPKETKRSFFFFFLWCWLRSLLVTHRFLAGKACHCSKKSLVSRQEKRCCQNYRVAYHRPYRKFDSLEMPDFLTKPKKKKASHLTTSIPIWGERSEATAQVFSGLRKQWAGLEFLTVNALVVESW